ncbi:NUDIX hydrolase [Telmatospirillum siberiense]|uniref:NUDIX hydrolase n=1 Tax=Telmatospirillum siberiense TaxID=382514 RepID=A0A2N3PYW3_9PROT|nr:NUDIX hydrolase [Telmatospirillum siberiense]PKU25606.1 NUDIX hydrolase [Telmatospirillum siberiense]
MGDGRTKEKLFQQYAALPYAVRDGELMVALITSRQSGRWIIPKGWPEKGLSGHEVAAREAFEEAGLVGEVDLVPLSSFRYAKRLDGAVRKLCEVEVYALAVHQVLDDWPERHQRQREWLTPGQAAMRVTDAGLIQLLLDLTDYGEEEAEKPVGLSMIRFR